MGDTRDDWITVKTLHSVVEVELVRSLLQSEGIECFVQGETHRSMLGMVGTYIEPRLMVRGADRERALEILRDQEAAQRNPDEVHYLCDPGTERPELKDLDNLVLDLEELTLCSIGRGTPLAVIDAHLGESTRYDGERIELRHPDLGAVFYLDPQELLDSFLVVVSPQWAYPDLAVFPGFWSPGAKLSPPARADLIALYGDGYTRSKEESGTVLQWSVEGAVVEAEFDDGGGLATLVVRFVSS